MSGLDSHWNDELDGEWSRRGVLTSEEILRAQHDLTQAVKNRVKVALIMEGWISIGPETEPRWLRFRAVRRGAILAAQHL